MRFALCVALVAAAAVMPASGAARQSFDFPPLMQPPAAEHPGKLVWAELVTPDLAAAERFYGGLFGWTFHEIHAGETRYAIAKLDNEPIAGLVQRSVQPDKHGQSAWLPFLSVSNVQETGQRIVEHGGKELKAPRAYRMRGQQATYTDPQGAVFAVLNSHSGDPPDVLAAPGEWIWGAVITRDPDSDAAFYQDVFGYEVFELPSDARGEHLLLASENYARASVNPLPQANADVQPHWTGFVRVTDVPHAAETAKALGGRVLVEPHEDRHGGTVALLADPAGAVIGIMDWTQTTPPGESPAGESPPATAPPGASK
jgi:predicted enzyme related to lactoylglutathione lyase